MMAHYSLRLRRRIDDFLKGKPDSVKQRFEAFLESAPVMYGVRANRDFVTIESILCHVLDADDVIWCHHFTMKVKYAVVFPIGRTHAIIFCTKDGKDYRAVMPSEKAAENLLKLLRIQLPHAVFGSDDKFFAIWREGGDDLAEKFRRAAQP